MAARQINKACKLSYLSVSCTPYGATNDDCIGPLALIALIATYKLPTGCRVRFLWRAFSFGVW
jgi:hypothetical protein